MRVYWDSLVIRKGWIVVDWLSDFIQLCVGNLTAGRPKKKMD